MSFTSPDRPSYAELHAHSVFTFLDGANTPAALVDESVRLGYEALGVVDVDGMYSAVQTQSAARAAGLPVVHGAELTLSRTDFAALTRNPAAREVGWGLLPGAEDPGIRLPILCASPSGRQHLCRAMSAHTLVQGRRMQAAHDLEDLASAAHDWVILTGTRRGPLRRALAAGGWDAAVDCVERIVSLFGSENVCVESALVPTDPPELADALAALARAKGLRLVATGATRCATPASQALADVLAATRLNEPLARIEKHLPALCTFLRNPAEMAALHDRHPHAVDEAAALGRELAFDLNDAPPRLPDVDVPTGYTPATWLSELAIRGALSRYGTREEHPRAWEMIDHELAVIIELDFPGYFLIVKEIVDFCADNGILCQGRGSAANSAVCYCLGITAVDAVRHQLLFERFLSTGRSGPPDIDLDIQSDRREEVIQHVYQRYGRHRAALVANVISYRPRSALRDAGRAFGYSEDLVTRWTKRKHRPQDGPPEKVRAVAQALLTLPRHMGIHPGGMVLTRTPVADVCPLNWGAMPDRSVLQWDKDDCADAGLVKFDLLGLGMLAALNTAFTALRHQGCTGVGGLPLGLHNLPAEDPRVYELLCAADTVGVFQVESRAQMNTLPRMKPQCFYDIVVEVALIRPGPIQGGAVNPYLRRRRGEEAVTYAHPLLKGALEKTLGVPLFQEQLMQMAVDAAGFSPAQADELRRAMGSKRSPERMARLRPALLAGMADRGIAEDTAEGIYDKLHAFADFGFPESHAFSFAHIVYASAWLKVHHPEYFYAAILANQPMGFYSPSSLIHDARRHGVAVTAPDVCHSDVEACVALRRADTPHCAPQPGVMRLEVDPERHIQLGLASIKGLGNAAARIVQARQSRTFDNLRDLAERAQLGERELEMLAESGALASLGVSRREGIWAAASLAQPPTRKDAQWIQPYLPGTEVGASAPTLPQLSKPESVILDHERMGLSVAAHPMALLRPTLSADVVPIAQVSGHEAGDMLSVVGAVTHRQRPPTAHGLTFLSLEDETGIINVTCPADVWRRYQYAGLSAHILHIRGRLEKDEGALSVRAHHLAACELPIEVRSRDFR